MVKRTDVKVPVKQDGKTKRTLEGEITAFRTWLSKHQERKPSDKTLLNYEKFFVTLTTTYGLDIENLNPLAVCDSVKQVSTSPYTKRQYLNTLKHYLKYRGIKITDELKQALKAQRGDKTKILTPNDLITREELESIIKNTRSIMLRAYYAMLWDTGARPSELARLDIQNFSEDENGFVIHITKSKTASGRRKVRIMTPYCMQQIALWWNTHPQRNDPSAPLFLNKDENRLSVHPVLNNLRNQHNKRLGRGNGNGKAPLNLYLFRKSAATRWIKEGRLSDRDIKKLLGHTPQSTMLDQYYAILSAEDLAESQLKAMGIVEAKKEQNALVSCPNPNCGMMNEPEATHCLRCKYPLTEEANQKYVSIEEQVATLETAYTDLHKKHTEIQEFLKKEVQQEVAKEQARGLAGAAVESLTRLFYALATKPKKETDAFIKMLKDTKPDKSPEQILQAANEFLDKEYGTTVIDGVIHVDKSKPKKVKKSKKQSRKKKK